MIVKVQTPLVGDGQALVYDEKRTFEVLVDLWFVRTIMGERKKAFFHAEIDGQTLKLGDEAEWQEW